jgi:hypothetical protein
MESKGRAGACRVGKLLAGENRDWQKRRENKDEMRAKKKIRENRWGGREIWRVKATIQGEFLGHLISSYFATGFGRDVWGWAIGREIFERTAGIRAGARFALGVEI